jgi:hypothetical protein
VDASYVFRPDWKSHTGATMSMSKVSVYSQSCKQKLMSRSSIETELTGVYDVSRQMNWTCHFWEAQNFAIPNNVLYQVAGRELSRLKQQEYQAHPYQIIFSRTVSSTRKLVSTIAPDWSVIS